MAKIKPGFRHLFWLVAAALVIFLLPYIPLYFLTHNVGISALGAGLIGAVVVVVLILVHNVSDPYPPPRPR